jgi:co-chaperonin GroES (HSP10)
VESQNNHKLLKAIGSNPRLIKPLGNYIVIDVFKAQKETEGGLVLPEQVVDRDRQMLARVIAVGPGQRALLDSQCVGVFVKPGDLILLLKHAPIEIKLGGAVCHVIAEGDIIGTVDEDELQKVLDTEPEQVEPEVAAEEVVEDPVEQTAGGVWVPKART